MSTKYYYDHDSEISWKITGILLLIVAVLWFAGKIWSADKYNNGVCQNCGGHYVFKQAVGHQVSTEYMYVCDRCGNMIQIDNFYSDSK